MRFHHDRRDKRLALRVYGASGEVCAQTEVVIDTLYIDLTFEPDASRMGELEKFGLLGRLGQRSLELEFFHDAPDTEEVLNCLGKHVIRERLVRAKQDKEARRPKGPRQKDSRIPDKPLPWMWLVCGGKPERAIEALGFEPAFGWPKGFYGLKERYGVGIIVLGELEANRETLLLRLFGKGKVLALARKELNALPRNAPERRIAMAVDKVFVGNKWNRQAWLEEVAEADKLWFEMIEHERMLREKREALALGKTLLIYFEARFGPMPVTLRPQLIPLPDKATLLDCLRCVAEAASAKEAAKAMSKRLGN